MDNDIPPSPDTLPPTSDEPTRAELMTAVLSMRDSIAREIANAFLAFHERLDRLEEDTTQQNVYVRDQLDAVKRVVENVTTMHLALEKRVGTIETRITANSDARHVVDALNHIASAIAGTPMSSMSSPPVPELKP